MYANYGGLFFVVASGLCACSLGLDDPRVEQTALYSEGSALVHEEESTGDDACTYACGGPTDQWDCKPEIDVGGFSISFKCDPSRTCEGDEGTVPGTCIAVYGAGGGPIQDDVTESPGPDAYEEPVDPDSDEEPADPDACTYDCGGPTDQWDCKPEIDVGGFSISFKCDPSRTCEGDEGTVPGTCIAVYGAGGGPIGNASSGGVY